MTTTSLYNFLARRSSRNELGTWVADLFLLWNATPGFYLPGNIRVSINQRSQALVWYAGRQGPAYLYARTLTTPPVDLHSVPGLASFLAFKDEAATTLDQDEVVTCHSTRMAPRKRA